MFEELYRNYKERNNNSRCKENFPPEGAREEIEFLLEELDEISEREAAGGNKKRSQKEN